MAKDRVNWRERERESTVKFQKCRRFLHKLKGLGELCVNRRVSEYQRIVRKLEYFTSSPRIKITLDQL